MDKKTDVTLNKLVREGLQSSDYRAWFNSLPQEHKSRLFLAYFTRFADETVFVEHEPNYGVTSKKPNLDYYDQMAPIYRDNV